jgi:5-methylcytosine-specific restriction enzyme subunit McrC
MIDDLRIIELREYDRINLPENALAEPEAALLYEKYGTQVAIEPPSFHNQHQWSLTSQGWVGYIPLTPALAFRLQPKTPLHNLFGMWEYAYRLKSFRFLDDLAAVQSLEEFYEQLANILSRRVLDRARKGFHRSYIHRYDRLPYVRGRIDAYQAVRSPWDVRLPCHFEEHTADIDDNRILTYTLWRIARSGVCSERVLPIVRNAYRSLQGITTFYPFSANDCVGRPYNRLNQDYHALHALSRFFLEQTGPTHRVGDRQIMPFLVDMAQLFELFVAEWLKAHLPAGWLVQAQEQFCFGQNHNMSFKIDLVLRHVDAERPYMVLDTKYKVPDKPDTSDISQVVAYAEALGCTESVLIYPAHLKDSLDDRIGDIRVRTLTFSLDGDLERAGEVLLQQLGVGAVAAS